ncbi:MAG: phosphate uptake regulator PhoU [Candidatus Heimdallarchaeota archaeon]|nr:phosphate uptake regulator PhoU [Candidatus Heimdallarchaeota archaeon]
MEIRKIQVTGAGDTRIISLPKEWAERHNLDKGSNIIIKELTNGDLIIYPQDSLSEKRFSRIIESDHVSRDILAAYLLGSDVIIVSSKKGESFSKRSEIKELSRQLIGLEVLGETKDSIELHFLIGEEKENPKKYVKRCFSIANLMQKDAFMAFLNSDIILADEVIERDVEVNRLYFLIVRMLKIMVDDKREISYLKSTACLDWRMVAAYGEDLGDAAVEFAEMIKNSPEMKDKLSKTTLSKIRTLSELTTDVLKESLESFFSQNVNVAEKLKNRIRNQLQNLHTEIQEDISKLETEVVWKLSSLLNFFKLLRETAIDIGDLVIANDTSIDSDSINNE